MATMKYRHSIVTPSELFSICGGTLHFVDQPSGGRVLRFRRICQISGFSMCPPGMRKDVNDPWMLCAKMLHSIGNAHGKV